MRCRHGSLTPFTRLLFRPPGAGDTDPLDIVAKIVKSIGFKTIFTGFYFIELKNSLHHDYRRNICFKTMCIQKVYLLCLKKLFNVICDTYVVQDYLKNVRRM